LASWFHVFLYQHHHVWGIIRHSILPIKACFCDLPASSDKSCGCTSMQQCQSSYNTLMIWYCLLDLSSGHEAVHRDTWQTPFIADTHLAVPSLCCPAESCLFQDNTLFITISPGYFWLGCLWHEPGYMLVVWSSDCKWRWWDRWCCQLIFGAMLWLKCCRTKFLAFLCNSNFLKHGQCQCALQKVNKSWHNYMANKEPFSSLRCLFCSTRTCSKSFWKQCHCY
jgi:hypothetical protein